MRLTRAPSRCARNRRPAYPTGITVIVTAICLCFIVSAAVKVV
jgi:hypothetical protein